MQLRRRVRLHLTVSCRADGVSQCWARSKLGAVGAVSSRPLPNVAARPLQWTPRAATRWCAGPGQRQSALTTGERRVILGLGSHCRTLWVYSVQIRYLLLVATGMLELLGWRALVREVSYACMVGTCLQDTTQYTRTKSNRQQAREDTYFSPVGVPETEVFLELGREVLILMLGSCNNW